MHKVKLLLLAMYHAMNTVGLHIVKLRAQNKHLKLVNHLLEIVANNTADC